MLKMKQIFDLIVLIRIRNSIANYILKSFNKKKLSSVNMLRLGCSGSGLIELEPHLNCAFGIDISTDGIKNLKKFSIDELVKKSRLVRKIKHNLLVDDNDWIFVSIWQKIA